MRARDRSRRGTFLLRASLAAILSVIGVLALAALATAGDGTPSKGWHKGKGYSKVATCPKGTVRFKFEPVVSGTKGDGTFSVTITRTDSSAGERFDFTSNLPVTTVYVKGGPKAKRYDYSPPVTSGTGLHAPKNWHSGKWYGLSNVVFCYKPGSPPPAGLKVEVSKTAKTTFTRTHQWKIGKWAKPSKWNLFEGDSGTSKYVVAVKKKGYADSNWAVSGTIAIKNPTTAAATVTSVTDTISGGINATVSCGVTFPYTLAAGATLNCSYSASLPDGASRTNTATVATSGAVGGGSGTAAVTFGAPTTVTNGTITVNDSNGMSWSFSDSGYKTYSKKFTCGSGGTFTNTATIAQTGQSASATVVVKCWELEVSKDVKTATLKKWDWSITKTASPTTLNLNEGQTGSVSYTVKLDAEAQTKGAFASGKIRVHNPSPLDAVLESVTDVVSPNIAAKVDCDVKFPYELESGDTLECKYAVVLPDASTRTNTATATIRNHDYAYGHDHDDDGKDKDDDHGKKDDSKKDDDHGKKGHGSPSGTTSFTGTAPVSFTGGGAKELDRCVEVFDTRKGKLGVVCAHDANKTFTYTLTFGTKGTNANVIVGCGETTYPNTASFETKDTEKTGTANASVTIKVTCTTPTPPTPSPTIDLVLDKVATSPTAFNGTVTYTLKVTNKGPGTATNVQLADPAPAGISYTSATAGQGTCAVTAALVTCDLGSIAAGQTVTVTVKAKATKVGPLSNTATVVGQGGIETTPADNSDTAQTTVSAPLKPPTAKKGKKQPKQRVRPRAAACLLMTVTPKSITVDDRPDRVRVLVTAAKVRQRSVRVVVRGAGVSKAARTKRNGVAVLVINARRPGVITVTARERNREVCGTRRIGVVAAFAVPLTG